MAFHDPRAEGENGYASLSGSVRELSDPKERRRVWKDSWTLFHTAPEICPPDSDVLVYVFEPETLELVDNERWLRGDWRPVTIEKDAAGRWRVPPEPSREARAAATAQARAAADAPR